MLFNDLLSQKKKKKRGKVGRNSAVWLIITSLMFIVKMISRSDHKNTISINYLQFHANTLEIAIIFVSCVIAIGYIS